MRFPHDDIPFRTLVNAVGMDAPFHTLSNGSEVGKLPLCDRLAPTLPGGEFLRGSLVRTDAITALALWDCELCSPEDLELIAREGIWVPPVTLVRGGPPEATRYDQAHMQSLGYKIQHDVQFWLAMAARGYHYDNMDQWPGPAVNCGKTQRGLRPGETENGDCYLMGWDHTDDGRPGFIQKGTGAVHRGEARSLRDYGTNIYYRKRHG